MTMNKEKMVKFSGTDLQGNKVDLTISDKFIFSFDDMTKTGNFNYQYDFVGDKNSSNPTALTRPVSFCKAMPEEINTITSVKLDSLGLEGYTWYYLRNTENGKKVGRVNTCFIINEAKKKVLGAWLIPKSAIDLVADYSKQHNWDKAHNVYKQMAGRTKNGSTANRELVTIAKKEL